MVSESIYGHLVGFRGLQSLYNYRSILSVCLKRGMDLFVLNRTGKGLSSQRLTYTKNIGRVHPPPLLLPGRKGTAHQASLRVVHLDMARVTRERVRARNESAYSPGHTSSYAWSTKTQQLLLYLFVCTSNVILVKYITSL